MRVALGKVFCLCMSTFLYDMMFQIKRDVKNQSFQNEQQSFVYILGTNIRTFLLTQFLKISQNAHALQQLI